MKRPVVLNTLFSFFLILSQTAGAGIRVVGGGGGLAELQVLSLDQKLAGLLKILLTENNPAQLSPEEKQTLSNLLKAKEGGSGKNIVFSQDCLSPKIQFRSESILVSSCALYENDQPLSLPELAAFVFDWRLAESAPQLPESEKRDISKKIWRDFHEGNAENLQISLQPAVYLRARELVMGEQVLSLLAAETVAGSVDLAPDLIQALNCTEANPNWGFRSLVMESEELGRTSVSGQIQWSCDGKSFAAKATLVLPTQSDLSKWPGHILVRVTQKEQRSHSVFFSSY